MVPGFLVTVFTGLGKADQGFFFAQKNFTCCLGNLAFQPV